VRVPSRVTAVGVAWFPAYRGAFEERVGVAVSPSGTVTSLFTCSRGFDASVAGASEAMLGLPRGLALVATRRGEHPRS
jgi:hypothetical protein